MPPIIRGDDISIIVTCKDETTGLAIDITGYSVFFTVKKRIADADVSALVSKKVTSHTDPTAGQTTISLTHTETAVLKEGDYIYDFQLIDGSGNISSTQRSQFVVLDDVTIRTS